MARQKHGGPQRPPWASESLPNGIITGQLCKGGAPVQSCIYDMQVDSAKEAAAAEAAAQQADAIAADNADGLGEDRRKAVLAEAEAATAGKVPCSHHGGACRRNVSLRAYFCYLCTWPG